jgi:DNA gyrase/topoisomerase IV subunit A
MAWHTVQDTLKLTGRSRSQLYRDMARGLVSYRTGKDGRREFETSELIRAYGELRTEETQKRHRKGQSKNGNAVAENPQLEEIQKQLSVLQQSVILMLEDKAARETERRQHDEERTQLQAEISRLNEALKQEKKRSVWSRLFRRNTEDK